MKVEKKTSSFFIKEAYNAYLLAVANFVVAYNRKCKELDLETNSKEKYFLEGETVNLNEDILRLRKVADNLHIPLDNLNNLIDTIEKEI